MKPSRKERFTSFAPTEDAEKIKTLNFKLLKLCSNSDLFSQQKLYIYF